MDNIQLTPSGLIVDGITGLQNITITSNPSLPNIAFPALTSVTAVKILSNPVLTTVDLNALVSAATEIRISFNTALVSLSLGSLTFANKMLVVTANPLLVTLNLPALVSVAVGNDRNVFNTDGCTSLANVTFPNYLPTNNHFQQFRNCALTETSVDHILARCVANAGYVTGAVFLEGGTSAPPSITGAADKATLIARGVNVITN